MLGINDDLRKLESEGRRIRLGVSGATWMGSGLVTQIGHMQGIEVAVIADANVEAARRVFLDAGYADSAIETTDNVPRAQTALRHQRRVVTADHTLPARLDGVDIVTDATDSPSIGSETAHSCIQHGKNVVLINIEADVTVGSVLQRMARQAGVVYTVSSGDEPGALKELCDFADALGYEIVAIGKGKNNPLNRRANPENTAEQARRQGKSPAQVAYFVDGTKTMFEMACVANATGFVPATRGMFGPEATLETVARVFALRADGGIVPHPGIVDYVTGSAMAGGVFVVVRVGDKRIQDDLEYLKVGKGPYFAFFRPYHLWFLEAPISIARAHLYKAQTLVPLDRPTADVLTVAKQNLRAGEVLDGLGGFATYGLVEDASVARAMSALPMGLAIGATVRHDVAQDEILRYQDVALDESSLIVRLRRQQDSLHTTQGQATPLPTAPA